jgi:hypothetical protein
MRVRKLKKYNLSCRMFKLFPGVEVRILLKY